MSTKLQKQSRKDLESLMKLAAAGDMMTKATSAYLMGIAKPLIGVLAGVAIPAGAAYYFTKKDKERHKEDLMNSMKSLAQKSPEFKKNPEKFFERFGELTIISPTIAKNPSLAAKLLDKKLSSGFSVDDIHKLTSIEANTSNRGGYSPGAAARASAGHALTTIVNAFGHDAVNYYGGLHHTNKKVMGQVGRLKKGTADVNRKADEEDAKFEAQYGGDMDKKSSAQRVSDECLGTMLAERYVLIKQAGVFSTGMKNMATGLQYFAPAIALGGGLELLRQAVESRRNSQLEQQADHHFSQLIRSSDIVKGPENMALAREAFSTLKAVAPSLAARPLVAKTFIEFTVGAGQLAPQTVQQLAEAEDKIRGAAGKGGFFEELKASIGGKGVSSMMNPSTLDGIRGGNGPSYLNRSKKKKS
jgi:hypothetical protein